MTILRDLDFGTPARVSETTVSLDIDGIEVTVPAGTSVMRAAAQAGVAVPKLCATDSLDAFGSCRLCVVDIDAREPSVVAELVEVRIGKKFLVDFETLVAARLFNVEAILATHPYGGDP